MLGGHFIDSSQGRVFLASWKNEERPATAVLCLPPLAEELNCSRRAIAVQCQALVNHDMDCFLLDYYGTGDSEGEFAEATLAAWEQDVSAAIEWLRAQGYERLLLWGMRFGGTLAARVLQQSSPGLVDGLLLWQPLESGGRLLRSLMRMRAMNNTAVEEDSASFPGIDAAGYHLSNQFIEDLEKLELATSREALAHTAAVCIGIVVREGGSQALKQDFPEITRWSEVVATPFWSIPEAPISDVLTGVTTEQMLTLAGTERLQADSA